MDLPALLVVARHGESYTNKLMEGIASPFAPTEEIAQKIRAYGHHDVPLTGEGVTQADILAKELQDRHGSFDVIIDSGLLRAVQTADRIEMLFPGTRRITDSRLRERDPGYGYSMTEEQFYQHFPWMRWYWEHTPRYLARPVGGESIAEVVDRVRPCLKHIGRRFRLRRVLIVAHGRTNQAVRIINEKWPTSGNHLPVPVLPNCGTITYRRSETSGKLLLEHVTL